MGGYPTRIAVYPEGGRVYVADWETGQVKVLRFVAAQDVGRAIHPGYVEGQLQGKAEQIESIHARLSASVANTRAIGAGASPLRNTRPPRHHVTSALSSSGVH